MRAIRYRYFARSAGEIAGPAVLEGVAGGADGEVDFLGGRLADLGQRFLARGVDRRVGLLRLEPLPADEVPVAVAELNEVARLGRRRVVPGSRNGRAILLALELGHRDPPAGRPGAYAHHPPPTRRGRGSTLARGCSLVCADFGPNQSTVK